MVGQPYQAKALVLNYKRSKTCIAVVIIEQMTKMLLKFRYAVSVFSRSTLS